MCFEWKYFIHLRFHGKNAKEFINGTKLIFFPYLATKNIKEEVMGLWNSDKILGFFLTFFLFEFLKRQPTIHLIFPCSDSHVLTDDQNKWIDKVESRIYELMAETPPYGEKFGKSVKHILHREEQWNLWKNQGCKSLISKPPVVEDKKLDAESKDSNNATSSKISFFYPTCESRLLKYISFYNCSKFRSFHSQHFLMHWVRASLQLPKFT